MARASTDPRGSAARGRAGLPSIRPDVAAAVACGTLVLLAPRTGHAYLDPGIASFAVQGIVGGLAAIAAGIAGYWRRIITLLKRRPADRTSGADREPGA
jgi:hypothetical protein